MKYILFTNQKKAIELGLKNRSQLDILDVISTCHLWAQIEEINGVYFHWVARQKIIEELPILNLKPDTVYKHLTILKEKGFIFYEKLGKKDCVKLTQKGTSLFTSTMSEKNPSSYVRKKSESNSELNPTYNTTNINNTTKDNNKKEKSVKTLPPRLNKQQMQIKKQVGVKGYKLLADNKQMFAGLGNEKISLFIDWMAFRYKPTGLNKPIGNDGVLKAQLKHFFKCEVKTIKAAIEMASTSGVKGWIDINFAFDKVMTEKTGFKQPTTPYVRPQQNTLQSWK